MTDTSVSWLSRLVATTTVTFVSPLPRTECVERLQSELGSWWPPFRRRTVSGSVRAHGFVLRKASGFGPGRVCARGTLTSLPSGTRVFLSLGRQRWRGALERLSVVVALVCCGALAAGVWRSPGAPPWALLIPAAFLGQTLLLAVRLPRLRGEESRYLTRLLQLLLESADAPEDRSAHPRQQVVDGGP